MYFISDGVICDELGEFLRFGIMIRTVSDRIS